MSPLQRRRLLRAFRGRVDVLHGYGVAVPTVWAPRELGHQAETLNRLVAGGLLARGDQAPRGGGGR